MRCVGRCCLPDLWIIIVASRKRKKKARSAGVQQEGMNVMRHTVPVGHRGVWLGGVRGVGGLVYTPGSCGQNPKLRDFEQARRSNLPAGARTSPLGFPPARQSQTGTKTLIV